jgi:cell division septum initiation protein DivIVA
MTEARELVGPGNQLTEFPVGAIVSGKTARVALANGWAEEVPDDTPESAPAEVSGEQTPSQAVAAMVDALGQAKRDLAERDARIAELEARQGDADDESARSTIQAAEDEAARIMARAEEDAGKIVDEAKAKAAEIVADAEKKAKGTLNAELDALKAGKTTKSGGGSAK